MPAATPRSRPAWPAPVRACTDRGLRTVVLERPGPVAAVRLTVAVGARDDTAPGAAHLLEHLLFRTPEGAAARREVEAAGGEIGATTTREQLSIDVVTLPDDLPQALAALGRIVATAPRPTDLERERNVILREIAHEGEERRLIWQLQAEALYGADHPLARPILGTQASIEAIAIEDVAAAGSRLTACNAALAAVGPVAPDAISELANRLPLPAAPAPPAHPAPSPAVLGRRHVERRSDLLHLATGWRFGGLDDTKLPALRLAEIVLAHGSGSRLYERLRTRRRLAYRVSTMLVPYRDAGHVSAVTSCDPHHASQAEMAIVAELERLAVHGPTWVELEAARRQHAGMTARRYESSRQLAAWAATQLLWDRLEPVGDALARVDAVEPGDVRDACAGLVRGGHAVASVGRTPRTA